jgi:hypothetical protein
MGKHPLAIAALCSMLGAADADAGEPTAGQPVVVDWKCKERVVAGTAREARDREAFLQTCIQGWLPRHVAAAFKALKPSGKPAITAFAASGDGAACGPDGDDEGGEVLTSFIALLPVTGDDRLSKLVLKVETTLSFCHEKTRTRLGGAITTVTTIR